MHKIFFALLASSTMACVTNAPCSPNTVFLNLTFDAASGAATSLEITIDVASRGSKSYTVNKSAGARTLGIQVSFSAAYPAGQMFSVTVLALAGSDALGGASQQLTLAGGCSSTSIAVVGGVSFPDMAVSVDDLAGADLSTTIEDLAGADLLPGPDLAMPADLACSCLPAPPAGWLYARVVEQASAALPACPPGYDSTPAIGIGAKDDGCNDCSCGSPIDMGCGMCLKRYFKSTAPTCTEVAPFEDTCAYNTTQCWSIASSGSPQQTILPTGNPQGRCLPNQAPKTKTFNTNVGICTLSSSAPSCSMGGVVCVAPTSASYQNTLCVMRIAQVDDTCPTGYPNKRTYSTGFTDTRACNSGCSCGSATGITCTGGVLVDCANPNINTPFGVCGTFSPPADMAIIPSGVTIQADPDPTPTVGAGAGCPPSGNPVESGSLTVTGTQVLCCQ